MRGSDEWKEKVSLMLNIFIIFNYKCKLVFIQMGELKVFDFIQDYILGFEYYVDQFEYVFINIL